jgi:hypothetical protein
LSSVDAAGVTCRNARANSPASSWTGSASVGGSFGYSSAAVTRRLNSARSAVMRASSPLVLSLPTSTVTAPGGSARTTSLASFAGNTVAPSVSPLTSAPTVIVRSRSLPVRVSTLPMSSARTPDSTGNIPPLPETARPAVPRASTKVSRSHRNFTAARFLFVVFSQSSS